MNNYISLVAALLAGLLVAQPDDAKVKSLLAELEDPTNGKRFAAEWELLKLGPAILPLLPAAPKASDRLLMIRDTLRELQPRTWEVKAGEMSLANALEALKKNTGLVLMDRRQNSLGHSVKLSEKTATYWEIV